MATTRKTKTPATPKTATPTTAVVPATKPALPAIPGSRTAAAMQGAIEISIEKLRDAAPELVRQAIEYALDPKSPYHEKFLAMFIERLAPVRGAAAQMIREVGGDGSGTTQTVTINVVTANPREVPAAITVRATEPHSFPDESE